MGFVHRLNYSCELQLPLFLARIPYRRVLPLQMCVLLCLAFIWALESQTQDIQLAQQVLCSRNHLPNPVKEFYFMFKSTYWFR